MAWNRRAVSGKPYAHPQKLAQQRRLIQSRSAGTWHGWVCDQLLDMHNHRRRWVMAVLLFSLRWGTWIQARLTSPDPPPREPGAWLLPSIIAWRKRHPLNIWRICQRECGTAAVEMWRVIETTKALVRSAVTRLTFVFHPWRLVPLAVVLALMLSFPDQAQAGVHHAALSATTLWDVRTTGSDTLNGGCFDPGQTAGMFTDGAATSATTTAPVFSSASYNFVAGDAGAWLFIASGTNWTAGWYPITSVASNVATLNATIGSAVVGSSTVFGLASTAQGCATTASPTGATWSIDYSQQNAAQFAYTDLSSVGAGLLVSSVALPFAKQQVGNCLVITGGTNFTAGRYVVASVAAGVATVVGPGNITTGAGVNGTGGLGGAFAYPAIPYNLARSGNCVFVQNGTYTFSSTTATVTNGRLSTAQTDMCLVGWSGLRTANNTGTKPLFQSSVAALTMFTSHENNFHYNIACDGGTQATGVAFSAGAYVRCSATGFTGASLGPPRFFRCTATVNSGAVIGTGTAVHCEAYANTGPGVSLSSGNGAIAAGCISSANTGATTDGFVFGSSGCSVLNCVAYANGRDGFRIAVRGGTVQNCISESNTGAGFNWTSTTTNSFSLNNAAYGNSADNTNRARVTTGFVSGSGSFFTNAAGGDFSLNNTAGGGAAVRALGFPGLFPRGLTTGYLDIGAAQHADPAASPSSVGFLIQ